MRSDSEETGDSGVGRMHDADAARRRARKTITMKPDVPKLPDILARALRPSYRSSTSQSVKEAETSPPTSAQKVLAAMGSKSREAADLRASRKKAKESKPYDPHTDQGDWKGAPVEESSSAPRAYDAQDFRNGAAKFHHTDNQNRFHMNHEHGVYHIRGFKAGKYFWDTATKHHEAMRQFDRHVSDIARNQKRPKTSSTSPSIKAESSSPSIRRISSMRRSFTSFITALSEARGSSPAFTRRHFQMVADVIKVHPHPEERKRLADHHATIFAGNNPRFDKAKFYAASGVTEETENNDDWTLNESLRPMIQGSGAHGVLHMIKVHGTVSDSEIRKTFRHGHMANLQHHVRAGRVQRLEKNHPDSGGSLSYKLTDRGHAEVKRLGPYTPDMHARVLAGWQPKNVPSKSVAEAILNWKKFAPGGER